MSNRKLEEVVVVEHQAEINDEGDTVLCTASRRRGIEEGKKISGE